VILGPMAPDLGHGPALPLRPPPREATEDRLASVLRAPKFAKRCKSGLLVSIPPPNLGIVFASPCGTGLLEP
jgi:hypothetical protein